MTRGGAHAAHRAGGPAPRTARRAGDRAPRAARRAGDLALSLAALFGTLTLLAALGAHLLGVRVVLFSTGSMTPTIPVGAAALTVAVAAPDVRPGDVVTVERVGQLPITHRVVSVGGTGVERDLVLRGDANDQPDPEPYRVRGVHRVVGVVPGVARALAWCGRPTSLAGMTVLASGLVLWAFWPREPRHRDRSSRRPRAAAVPSGPGPAAPRSTSAGVVLAGLLATGVAGVPAIPGGPPSDVVGGRYLHLTSVTSPAMTRLTVGGSADWFVGLRTTAPTAGDVTVSIDTDAAAGPSDAVRVAVDSCTVRWRADRCPGQQRVLVAAAPPDALAGRVLEQVRSTERRWYRFRVTVDPDATVAAQVLDVQVTATGFGDSVSTGSGALAGTGSMPGPGAVAAVVAVTAGVVLLLARAGCSTVRRRAAPAAARRQAGGAGASAAARAAAGRASSTRPSAAPSCAADTNHASNADGGA